MSDRRVLTYELANSVYGDLWSVLSELGDLIPIYPVPSVVF